MINKFLEAASDADLLQAAVDALSEKGWALDEERVELWLHDCEGREPGDPVDAETVWERMEAAVVEKLGSVYEDTGAPVTDACVRALRLTSAEALARMLGWYEAVRVEALAHWGGPSTMRTFDVEGRLVLVRDEDGAVRTRLWPAFAGEDDGSGLPVEYLGDALREVGLD